MANLEGVLYSKSHEWIHFLDDTTARIGITDYAQEALGDLVYISLPEVDDEVSIGETFADVESVKAVSEVYSPVDGLVSKVNEDLLDTPALINQSPYEAWFIEVKDITDQKDFLTAEEYAAFVQEEE